MSEFIEQAAPPSCRLEIKRHRL